MVSQIADGHYKYQVPIDAYGNGGFRFEDMSHIGSLLCLPSGMHKWAITNATQLDELDFTQIFERSDEIDVFLIGTGKDIAFIDESIREKFREHAIILEPMSTGAAVRTYNVLMAEKRAVSAGFIAIERAE
ncbi:Mth938-like domain-containing protein [Maritalea porphyrae]|uniref:Mth938-like domain-containing protein n=1 Tax=Maritalea porphyrae TaxID=880732 RepID=UPI0022B00AF5|nr:MTH938/NDUFAF3 family protein [Maritalea porphyrae]MCZ4273146.1 MTH938/NDUFAF3 family protein [Maritalea porphyrae]